VTEVSVRVCGLKDFLKALLVILLVPILGCGGCIAMLLVDSAVRQIPANVIRAAREQGGLAPLPPSATDVHTDGWSTGFSSARYIRFKAKPQEIEAFLATSPGLKGVSPERFSPKHMYLPYPKHTPNSDEELEESVRHKYFSLNGPSWYNPTIRVTGCRYAISWHGKV
jgi:hypothetical protein